ncbi:cohesin loading factor-domain-containing protein [Xylaria grammica]|nr:cohesin loading factor-domain-containing protein [Xylaria grammica]
MTYPGPLPHGQQLGFNQQNQQNHHHHQYVAAAAAEPHNAWPSPHTHTHTNNVQQRQQHQQQQPQQPQQYHHQHQQQHQQHQQQYQNNVAFAHVHAASQQQQQHQHQQQQQQQQQPRPLHPNQLSSHHGIPLSQLQHGQSHQQPQQLPPPPPPQQQQHANFQFHGYDPSFDQRPYAQPSPQNGMHPSAQMMQSIQQPIQPTNHYVQQQQQQQQQHSQLQQPLPPPPQQRQAPLQQQQQPQRMDWQHMPPPVSVASPSPSPYQNAQPPSQPQVQHQHHMPQHINSPVISHSPQVQHQQHANSPVMPHSPHVPPHVIPNNQHRTPSASARIEHVARVSASPRLTSQTVTRSPSVSSTRSPALAPVLIPNHQDTTSLLICMAEDFFSKARRGVRDVATTLDERSVHDYQKLIATGLACLEVAIGSNKLTPRLEALARLQYASILCTETNNVMEAETALTKGITLCERNRFADLKYCMHFLQVQLLFSQRKEKAALIAVDARIRDAEVVKHTHWVYAFRFLKTSFYLQSLNPTEAHALENLRAITVLAGQRGDRPIFAVASLLEALSHLRAMKDDAIVRIQACIAQASKYQLEDSMSIMQLDVLQLVLDLACSLQQKSPHMISQKLKALQDKMDASIKNTNWSFQDRQLLLPIHKQATNQQIISPDTSSIVRPGEDGDVYDYLAMSFWSKLEAFTTTYTYSGLALLYQQPRSDKKLFSLWEEALSQLRKNRAKIRGFAHCLEDAVQHVEWETEAACYLHILRGLHLATSTKWDEVQYCMTQLESMVVPTSGSTVVLYSMYLAGVYHQGTGNLDTAIGIYSHPNFSLNVDGTRGGHHKPAEFEVALLATFNLIWIMQDQYYRNDQRTQELLEQIRPLCMDHPNMEIRTAYNLVMAAIQTNPPVPMTAVKTHISTALSNAKNLADVHTLSIALNLMRAKLFQSIVGDQALKSAKAASTQARRSGNTLWMSVADGMLSQSYEVQGAMLEAQKVWHDATRFANQALKTSRE